MTEQIRVHLDYETFSKADIKEVGGAAYARHPSTEILMAAWAYAEGDAKQWDQNDGPMPQELIDILENKDGKYLVHAQNANFEIMVTIWAGKAYGLDVPDDTQRDELRRWLKNWRCTMVMGMGLSMPGALIDQNKILGVSGEEAKQAAEGKRLIQLFCMPRRPTKADPSPRATIETHPDFWSAFLEYNRMDVIAERANYKKLVCYKPMPQVEWDMWHLDQLINLTGLPIDLDLVEAALEVNDKVSALLLAEFKKLTGLSNPNSRKQMLNWLHNHTDYPLTYGLKKDDVNRVLRNDGISPKLRRALELRQATSKTSISKYVRLLAAAGGEHGDGKLRGAFQFAGAQRTRRWGGRIFQPQNLPRGILKRPEEMEAAITFVKARDVETLVCMYGSLEILPDILSSLIRNAVCAPEGRTLTVADLASIETVMTWWAADAHDQLAKVAKGVDAYKDYGSKLLSKPYDEITKAERTYSKPAVLGCCYRLGGPGLVAYAESMGVKMTKKEGYRAVDIYRDANPEVVALWDKLDAAFKECLTSGKNVVVNGKFRFRRKKPCVFIDLPGGRSLCYVQPKILPRTIKFEDRETGKMVEKDIMSITYMGVDQLTRKWVRMDTHGGKLLENIIQAIARDVLRDAMLALDKQGVTIVGHVHDEIIALTQTHESYRKTVEDAMVGSSPWCADAPLGASSFQNAFYMKD